jgi:uncharacterized membrane protein (TIGR02234 family)
VQGMVGGQVAGAESLAGAETLAGAESLAGAGTPAGAESLAGTDTAVTSQRGRREFALVLGVGALGAGLVLFAARQHFARVEVVPVHPLPVSVTWVSGQDLWPAVTALALAALASMAAVLATRGLLRRVTGVIAALLGAGIAVVAVGRVTSAAAISAAGSVNLSTAAAANGGSTPGSTTTGTDTGQASGGLSGFPTHVVFAGPGWRVAIVVGAAIVVAAGIAVIIRAPRLPAMSSRYERAGTGPGSGQSAGADHGPGRADRAAGQRSSAGTAADGPALTGPDEVAGAPAMAATSAATPRAGRRLQVRQRALLRSTGAANMWESLTAGDDPTVGISDD